MTGSTPETPALARAVRAWIADRAVVPDRVRVELAVLVDRTWEEVARTVAAARGTGRVVVYETNSELWVARPELRPLPARWWRHVVMRAVGGVERGADRVRGGVGGASA